MPEFTGTFGEVLARELDNLVKSTPIRQTVSGSKARALLESHSREVENLSKVSRSNLQKAYLPTTTGKFLEHFGATVGLVKYPQSNAEAFIEDKSIRAYTRLGTTFGSINGGNGFTIPEGTTLTAIGIASFDDTRSVEDITIGDTLRDTNIHYVTTADVYCASDKTEAFLPAKASSPGTFGNLASPGMISSHSFTNYLDHAGKTLLITNSKPITNGVDAETESSFRYRISKELTAAEEANETAVRMASLIPGVADVVLIPFEDGAGRFNIYVKATSPTVPDRILSAIQESIRATIAVGNIGYVRRPYEIGIEIDSVVTWRTALKEAEKTEIRKALVSASISYINSLDLGQPFILAELSNILRRVDSNVLAVGSNRVTLFDAVFGFYPARLAESGKRREKIIVPSIEIPPHARIIVEPSLSTPIRFI